MTLIERSCLALWFSLFSARDLARHSDEQGVATPPADACVGKFAVFKNSLISCTRHKRKICLVLVLVWRKANMKIGLMRLRVQWKTDRLFYYLGCEGGPFR